ncbi:histidine kinase dimerization/phospho-acceptor domain-containing protein [Halovivax cerinus]|uniref:histidine kinase n=1 Tax=Halovivax cerinus TaxID=1487865 RepID=A0ABD5NR92_9EURY|nr:histidine kinase dimerization/phospho-acceptor domain-containing protein [Halovivax cerinus]
MASTDEARAQLYDLVADLETAEASADVYELAVDWVAEKLGYADCGVLVPDENRFVPAAARARTLQANVTPLGVEEGIAGRTYRTGESQVIDDVRDVTTARPTSDAYRSVLSVSIGEHGVLQILSDAVGAFDDRDREMVERLATHVERSLERISHESAITRERDRFAALFENVSDAVIEYRVQEETVRIERVNASFVRHFEYEPSEAIDRSVQTLLVPELDSAPIEYQAAMNAGERHDTEVVRQTGEGPRTFLLRTVPTGADDVRRGYLIYTDISTLKDRERELERQNERLESFTSVVSHDLRNPLSIAMGYAELAVDDPSADHLSTVVGELERMDQMIDELLTLAKKGEVVGETEPISLDEAARSAWDHVETGAAELVVETETTIEADRPRLEEVFENLYRNAIEHGSPDVSLERPDEGDDRSSDAVDEPPLSVTVGSIEGAVDAGFFVADDGEGIDLDDRDQVLEMGFTGAADGTGFGLGIVSEIARAHGWNVSVTESREGGARFEFAGAESGPA